MPERWYYWLNGESLGPLTDSGLKESVSGAQIHPATPVRRGEDGQWMPAWIAIQQMQGFGYAQAQPLAQGQLSPAPPQGGPPEGAASRLPHQAAPLPSAAPQQPVEDDLFEERPLAVGMLLPFLTSAVFHLAIFILLGLMVSEVTRGTGTGTLNAAWLADPDDFVVDEAVLDIESPAIQEIDAAPLRDSMGGEESVAHLSVFEPFQVAMAVDTKMSIDMPFTLEELTRTWTAPNAMNQPITGRLRQAQTVGDATGGILEEIKKELELGKLLVVWMIDASISLADDRPRVADQLLAFLEELKQEEDEDSNQLINAAVAFGADVQEVEPSTKFGNRVVKAILEAPFDKSGVENVFTAVGWAARKYRKGWKDAIRIVVWTDESGDDWILLEQLIALCRKNRITVSIVGPSAILGREIGTQVWEHGPTGQVFNLPVDRGPDSALPERFSLPYWYETLSLSESSGSPSDQQAGRGLIDGFPAWYGGRQLEGIAAGFGPYPLTRLAMETGGSYTIFDRPADRGPFRLETLEPYVPDYRSVTELENDLKHNPLRRAIVTVANMTLRGGSRALPAMEFLSSSKEYVSQSEFHSRLGMVVRYRSAICAGLMRTTQVGLSQFGPNGMEELYEKETSPRWRAWYDLTRGRLLAVQVRCAEYLTACKMLPQSLNPQTNWFTFESSSELRGNAATLAQAEEAFRLLQRCVDANRGTPWEYLAQRELDHPLGIGLRQQTIPQPPPWRPSTRSGSGMPRPPEMPPSTITVTPPKL